VRIPGRNPRDAGWAAAYFARRASTAGSVFGRETTMSDVAPSTNSAAATITLHLGDGGV
jgi:hypothetical protein